MVENTEKPMVENTEKPMVENTEKPTVMTMGTLGIGKSTQLNRLVGKDETFVTSEKAEGCTQ